MKETGEKEKSRRESVDRRPSEQKKTAATPSTLTENAS